MMQCSNAEIRHGQGGRPLWRASGRPVQVRLVLVPLPAPCLVGVPPCFSSLALGVSPLPSMQWPVRYYPDARTRGEREEIGNEKICIIAGVGVGVGGDSIVARRGRPSSSPFRFRENRCWRLRWGGLHRRFFCHPSRRVRPRHGSFDDKVRSAGQARRVSQRAGGNHVSDDQIGSLRLSSRSDGRPAQRCCGPSQPG
jgi:hypothetical protein